MYSVFALDRFAVADLDTSRSLTNSAAASEFPSGKLYKDNELKPPLKLVITFKRTKRLHRPSVYRLQVFHTLPKSHSVHNMILWILLNVDMLAIC